MLDLIVIEGSLDKVDPLSVSVFVLVRFDSLTIVSVGDSPVLGCFVMANRQSSDNIFAAAVLIAYGDLLGVGVVIYGGVKTQCCGGCLVIRVRGCCH